MRRSRAVHAELLRMLWPTVRRAKPASVNLALAGVDHVYRYLGAGRPDVRREELAQAAPRALSPDELRRLLRAVERCESPRDRAIARLAFYKRTVEGRATRP